MKPLSKKELANAYGISLRTLKRWLLPLLDKLNMSETDYNRLRLFTPRQLRIIYKHLGEP